MKLDEKYQTMYDEFIRMRKKQKSLKDYFGNEMFTLRRDFEDWKNQEPRIIERTKIIEPPIVVNYEVVEKPPTPKPSVELTLEEKLLNLRQSLPELKVGDEVLAQWPDDGWYYRSRIKEKLSGYKYLIEDSLRDCEKIYRENIILEDTLTNTSFEVGHAFLKFSIHQL